MKNPFDPQIEPVELVTEQQGTPEMADTELHTQTTQCEHYMAWESHDIAVCTKGCGHGCSVNPDFFEIIDGKVVPKK